MNCRAPVAHLIGPGRADRPAQEAVSACASSRYWWSSLNARLARARRSSCTASSSSARTPARHRDPAEADDSRGSRRAVHRPALCACRRRSRAPEPTPSCPGPRERGSGSSVSPVGPAPQIPNDGIGWVSALPTKIRTPGGSDAPLVRTRADRYPRSHDSAGAPVGDDSDRRRAEVDPRPEDDREAATGSGARVPSPRPLTGAHRDADTLECLEARAAHGQRLLRHHAQAERLVDRGLGGAEAGCKDEQRRHAVPDPMSPTSYGASSTADITASLPRLVPLPR
jgi:hypothetical protein